MYQFNVVLFLFLSCWKLNLKLNCFKQAASPAKGTNEQKQQRIMILIFHTYMDLGLDGTCFFNDQLINHHQFSSNFFIYLFIVLHLRLSLFSLNPELNVSINLLFGTAT